jgi:hypothetical protein
LKRILFFSAFLIITAVAFSEYIPKKVYYTQRLENFPPEIDGKLEDSCWQSEEGWFDDFIQQQPDEGAPPSQETEFKILYDDKNLYVAIRAYDNEPEKIDVRFSRRDDFAGDCAGIAFDSDFDHRTAYEFNVTAAGGKIDLLQMDAGGYWFNDRNHDVVWNAKTAIEDSAWTIEMRIPFSQLRFSPKEEHVWGLHVWRRVYRTMEELNFQLLPADLQSRVHRYGILKGIKNIPNPKRIELLPYIRGDLNTFETDENNPFEESGIEWGKALGLDGRIAIAGDYNLDFTINPDFGQVEADPSVVNLTAFETFYEEKRPFFMEGKQLLNFELAGQSLFYSRRIGHSPGYHPSLENDEYADIPHNSTILGAAKLTAKTPTGWSVGVLNSITSKESAEIKNGLTRYETVEPTTNYTVGRLQRNFSKGQYSLGGMFTAVNRNIDESHLNFIPEAAYTGGFDWMAQWGNRSYYINVKGAFSHIRGHRDAILELQKSSVHYFQRTDAEHLELDSSKTSLTGMGGELEIGKGGNGRWRFEEEIELLSPGFELNDIGYIRQSDLIEQLSKISYVVDKTTGLFNYYGIHTYQYNQWNFNREHLLTGGEIYTYFRFKNFWVIQSFINHERNRVNTRLLRGGPAMRLPDQTTVYYGTSTDSRNRIQFDIDLYKRFFNDKVSNAWEIHTGADIRATDKLDLSFSPGYFFNRDNWQYVRVEDLSESSPYILGLIDQKTVNLTIRLDYYITPDFSIQYYGEPFISTGHFSNFKRVTNPKAKDLQDRYIVLEENMISVDPETGNIGVDENEDGIIEYSIRNPDFNFMSLHSNLVLRWEYNPGSTFYLVWTHTRLGNTTNGDLNFSKDLKELFDIYPDNVFLVKFNHWFSF